MSALFTRLGRLVEARPGSILEGPDRPVPLILRISDDYAARAHRLASHVVLGLEGPDRPVPLILRISQQLAGVLPSFRLAQPVDRILSKSPATRQRAAECSQAGVCDGNLRHVLAVASRVEGKGGANVFRFDFRLDEAVLPARVQTGLG